MDVECWPFATANGTECRATASNPAGEQRSQARFLTYDWAQKRMGAMVQSLAHSATSNFSEIATNLAATAKALHARGWLLGTSGNLSAVVQRDPLLLAMSPSGVDKGELSAEQILLVDAYARVVDGSAKPSDETLLHLEIVKQRNAGAVLHTHSVWNTVLSDLFADEGGLAIEGYEMLKGLAGIQTHEHREWIPIIENSQNMPELAATISQTLSEHEKAHGFLLHKHGLYTWGNNLRESKRHIEIMEFLIEARGRTLALKK